jgi:UDP:flavonoid glycosyltransferase YjiC (YdhE family)
MNFAKDATMASVLFCWELGAGFGHLTPHREVLATLARKGHKVHVAVRDLARAAQAFKGLPFCLWQAPTPQNRPEKKFAPTINFTQVLYNTGLGVPNGLGARISAWRSIFMATRPQVTLVDYTPTALLALRGLGIPTVVTGTGFFIPPNVSPLPAFPMLANLATPEKLAQEERQVLTVINAALAQHRTAPLTSVAQLFHEVSGKIFRSLPEFDHYPNRGPAEFLGLPPDPPRAPITWPAGDGLRVFAYLKPYPFLENLLTEIQQRRLTAIIACDGIAKAVQDKFACETMRFVPPTVDIAQMGRESHFAITNANLTTSVRLLLQGCPIMAIPLQLEQSLVAANFQKLGVGVMTRNTVADDLAPHLMEMMQKPKYREAARSVAAKYADRPDNYVEQAVAVMERFLPVPAVQTPPAAADLSGATSEVGKPQS